MYTHTTRKTDMKANGLKGADKHDYYMTRLLLIYDLKERGSKFNLLLGYTINS